VFFFLEMKKMGRRI